MIELVGAGRCACTFTLPRLSWPIDGWPAWVEVLRVDMPMVKMKSAFGGDPIWVNASIIETIRLV